MIIDNKIYRPSKVLLVIWMFRGPFNGSEYPENPEKFPKIVFFTDCRRFNSNPISSQFQDPNPIKLKTKIDLVIYMTAKNLLKDNSVVIKKNNGCKIKYWKGNWYNHKFLITDWLNERTNLLCPSTHCNKIHWIDTALHYMSYWQSPQPILFPVQLNNLELIVYDKNPLRYSS